MNEKINSHALPNQERWIILSEKEIKAIFIYYFVLFFASLALCLWLIYFFSSVQDKSHISIFCLSVASFSFGLLGSTFYYIRKLYKSCIQGLVDTNSDNVPVMSIGVKVYFYFRPIMGAVLAILIVLGLYGGFFVFQNQPSVDDTKFFIFAALFSFIIGFSNGKIILSLDRDADQVEELISFNKTIKREGIK